MLVSVATPPLYIVLPVALVAYWIIWIVYSRSFHPLSQYPGPYLASVSRAWIVFQVIGAQAEETQRDLHARYGPIVRIAPNEVAIADPTAIKTIYSVSSGFTKTDFYPTFRPSFARHPDLFTDLDEKSHARRRKIVNNLYSMSNIVRSEESIDNCTRTLMEKFHEISQKHDVIDMSTWLQWYAFDVIGELFFSRMFGFMAQATDYRGYIAALDRLLPMLTIACVMPSYLRPLFLIGGAIFPPIFKALISVKSIETAAKDAVDERSALMKKGMTDGQEDILSGLFGVMKTKGEKVDFGLTEITVEIYSAL
ncbi:unnamed protein product [Alternaria alternata]|uniref:Cytochrome P450 n=3 Tax=Alternaria alternata complex TaxID=187734 RepID=A0A4Q4NIS7_ALTAL|nr:hypothetical protein AA0115_g10631 [Alternaria tenuissima]RYN67557.1 hypothetical protein AA0118_g1433 [Alternaria tenuissima]RYN76941.1 hypothetical protein AA0117_g5369 [Alternaria alternata]